MKKKKPSYTGIGAIYNIIPNLYECNDGTYSTSTSSRGCARHGGKKTGEPLSFGGGNSKLNIRDVPLDKILIDKKMFQGREKDYSARSVQNIVSDVYDGKFVWANLDPITLWQNADGSLFLLSGHSRYEAFRRLAETGAIADGKDFKSIPAKIMKGVSLENAKTIALESNTLSTKETDLERAKYYRRLRQDGTDEKKLLENVKKNEGKNWVNVYAYTFLNPDGKAFSALKIFSDKEDTSGTLAKSLIKWIGSARRNSPELTNAHEEELYDWLFNNKGYGTGSAQVSSEREFSEKVGTFIQKNTFKGYFDTAKPLNITQQLYKSPVEQQFDQQINEAKANVIEAEKEVKSKIKSLTDRGASKAEIQRIVEPLEARLRAARIELQKLISRREQVVEYSKREAELFGGLRGIGYLFGRHKK